jgi:hypothetical protein
MSMRSSYNIFKGTSGFDEVLSRANDFVTRIGQENVIGINTVVDPSQVLTTGIGTSIAAGYPEEVVVIVWYWKKD